MSPYRDLPESADKGDEVLRAVIHNYQHEKRSRLPTRQTHEQMEARILELETLIDMVVKRLNKEM